MRSYEFYFSDLTEDAQSRYLDFLNIRNSKEANLDLDVIPIFELYGDEVVEIQEELFPLGPSTEELYTEDASIYDDKDRC